MGTTALKGNKVQSRVWGSHLFKEKRKRKGISIHVLVKVVRVAASEKIGRKGNLS